MKRTQSTIVILALALLAAGCSNGRSNRSSAALAAGSTAAPASSTVTPPAPPATTPELVLVSPVRPVKGLVAITFVLKDISSDPIDVGAEFTTNGGKTWAAASFSGSLAGLSSSSGGVAHTVSWDSQVDVGAANTIHARLRLTPSDAVAQGLPQRTHEFAVINLGRLDPDAAYDPRPGALAFRLWVGGGYAPRSFMVNNLDRVRIYGDGKIVYPSSASANTIHQGQLTEEQIVALLLGVKEKGFWSYQASYSTHVGGGLLMITDAPTWTIEANLSSRAHTSSAYAGAFSAPTGFMDHFTLFAPPALQPANVLSYTRVSITPNELAQGYYPGEEYQKKLDTPVSWSWKAGTQGTGWYKP